jgi:hypothetical protein
VADLLDDTWQSWGQHALLRRLAPIGVLMLLAAVARGNYGWYFQDFVPHILQTASAAGSLDAGLFLRKLAREPQAVIVSGGDSHIDAGVLEFLAPRAILCFATDPRTCLPQTKDAVAYIITPSAATELASVRADHPGGTLAVLHRYAGGAQLVAYTVRPGGRR